MIAEAALSDEQVYARLLAGEVAGLEQLMARYYRAIFGFCARQTGDRHLAEDLTQEVFTRLVAYSGVPPVRFRSWIYTIAANLVRDHFRSAGYQRSRPVPDDEQIEQHASPGALLTGEAAYRQVEQRQGLGEALARLPLEMRTTLILRFYHDLSLEEIAQATSVPVGTVKSRMFRALAALRPMLSDLPETLEREAPNA
jgi:RNA polymerase sigma-70 factor (ECF subfamily)